MIAERDLGACWHDHRRGMADGATLCRGPPGKNPAALIHPAQILPYPRLVGWALRMLGGAEVVGAEPFGEADGDSYEGVEGTAERALTVGAIETTLLGFGLAAQDTSS